MRDRAYRFLTIPLLGFALLVALPGLSTAETVSAANVSAPEPAFDFSTLTKAACHGNVSCQPNYPSCASWSGYSDCDAPFCGLGQGCGECICDEFRCKCFAGPAMKQYRERFRVCFDQFGNSCTEWQRILTTLFCDESC
jgi:hypothetical protein